MRTIYLDGQFLKVNIQIIEAFTPGVFKAKGVFETMLGLDGVVLDSAAHMRRLRQGLKTFDIPTPSINWSLFNGLLKFNKLASARVRLMVWKAGIQTHVMAAALPYKIHDKKIYRVGLVKTDRADNDRFSNVKSLDYGLNAQAFSRARAKGLDEALLLNRRGHIFEGSRSNVFWMKDRVMYTPPLSSGCLNGITRQQVIKKARSLKIPVQEKDLTPSMLKESDTSFLTNSLIGIKPCVLGPMDNYWL